MLQSQQSLATVQLSRNSLSEVAEAPNKPREIMLEGWRRRNAWLDTIFYDVGRVTLEEAKSVSPWLAREGSILVVPPSGSGPLEKFASVKAFEVANLARRVRILAIAGVGSSALGSAAYARNVADAFNEPVAVVVSGYGLADLLTEALGGWFLFSALNRMRHQFEVLDDLSRTATAEQTFASSADMLPALGQISRDTKVAIALLSSRSCRFELLTGHSKGNLVLAEALYELDEGAARHIGPTNPDPWIVTLSAAVAMPRRYKKIVDVIGSIDGFGALNSTPGISIEKRWPLSWHHTNTELAFHLPVTKVFQELRTTRGVMR